MHFIELGSTTTESILGDCRAARASEPPDARSWAQVLARYREPNHARSIVEIAITLGPLVALWVLAWVGYYLGFWWLSLLIAVPAAGFLVRLFMIQHDCGHGAFFSHRAANDWVGRVIGVLTLTPYDFWRRMHAAHHASSGNLDRRNAHGARISGAPVVGPPLLSALPASDRHLRHRPGATHEVFGRHS